MTDIPTMRAAFRTTVSGGGKYEMVFRFPSMDAMHQADDEWRALASDTIGNGGGDAIRMVDGDAAKHLWALGHIKETIPAYMGDQPKAQHYQALHAALDAAMDAIQNAASRADKPVAYYYSDGQQEWLSMRDDDAPKADCDYKIIPLYAHPPAAEPVAVETTDGYPVNAFSLKDVLAEMLAVATASITEDEDIIDEWPIDCRADVDRWQAVINGHLEKMNRAADPVGLREALKGMVALYDTDEGTRSLPQYKAAVAALSTQAACLTGAGEGVKARDILRAIAARMTTACDWTRSGKDHVKVRTADWHVLMEIGVQARAALTPADARKGGV